MPALRYLMVLGLVTTSSFGASVDSALPRTTADIVIEDSRIDLKKQPAQSIDLSRKLVTGLSSLESALVEQPNVQIVPSPLRGSGLTLNGFHGEQVAIYRDGDPILGRIDGSLDVRSVPLGNLERVSVYQGLDSLPYGSQNIAGAVNLESSWNPDPLYQLRSAAGAHGRLELGARAAQPFADGSTYAVSFNSWRSEAVRAHPDRIDTNIDASASVAADAMVTRRRAATLAGRDLEVRLGGSGMQSNTKGIFDGLPTTGADRRVQVFADLRRERSVVHASFSEARHRWREDGLLERAFRIGPELHETTGDLTWLAGAMADVHSTSSSRMPRGEENRATVGGYAGARYAISDAWVVGTGARYDTGPRLMSPRAEVRRLARVGAVEHTSVLETGLGFREPTPKELYLDFANPAVGYRITGNPALKTERAWITAVRHSAASKNFSVRGSVFEVYVRDAIGFYADGADRPSLRYGNISRTRTYGLEMNGEYRLPLSLKALAGYQWLRGHNVEAESDLFLQPRNRFSVGMARDELKGFSGGARATWTGRQGYFDYNRNRKIDEGEWAPSYWTMSFDLAYGFRWGGVAELMKIFGRVDNAFDVVRVDSLPVEPRAFLVGATVDL